MATSSLLALIDDIASILDDTAALISIFEGLKKALILRLVSS
jgi:predicted DNA repair protein MutK